jgi:hypothetical protein
MGYLATQCLEIHVRKKCPHLKNSSRLGGGGGDTLGSGQSITNRNNSLIFKNFLTLFRQLEIFIAEFMLNFWDIKDISQQIK